MMNVRSRRRKKRQESGFAVLAIVLILMISTAILLVPRTAGQGGDMATLSTNVLRLTRQRGDNILAQNLADTGLRMAMQWLIDQSSAPPNNTPFAPSSVSSFYGATADGGWSKITLNQGPTVNQNSSAIQVAGTIKVRFYPFSNNATSSQKMFCIESIGTFNNRSYIMRTMIRQNSFAKYAYFSDYAPTSWWVRGSTRFQGPVHVNGLNVARTAVDPAAVVNIIWRYSGSSSSKRTSDQIFTYPAPDYFTTPMAASQLKWYRTDGTTTWLETPTSTYYRNVASAGSMPKNNTPIITMPVATTEQLNAALGSTPVPTSSYWGVTVNPAAGIHINNDVQDMNLTTAGTGNVNQVIEVVQQQSASMFIRSVITIDRINNQTTVSRQTKTSVGASWGTATTNAYTGNTNGVIYVNGNIGTQGTTPSGGLSGAIANNVVVSGVITKYNALNIVTEQTKTINICGGVVYKDRISSSTNANNLLSTATAATVNSGILGLVAGKIQIVDKDDGGTALTNISVHAACMAYNTFNVTNYSTRTAGVFNLLGGYLVRTNGQFGVATPTGTVTNGFVVNRNYDQRLGDTPPPYYPATDRNYKITSSRRVLAPLE